MLSHRIEPSEYNLTKLLSRQHVETNPICQNVMSYAFLMGIILTMFHRDIQILSKQYHCCNAKGKIGKEYSMQMLFDKTV